MIHLILRTAYVLILSYHPQNQHLMSGDVHQLLKDYPQFQGQDEEELRYLLHFRNYLRLALIIIPARLSKQLLIKIAARLEGSRKEYITGGGQKQCVTRRVDIYENEGHIHAEKRTERARPNRLNGELPKKRTAPQALLRETKLLRLPSDDVSRLIRNPNEGRSLARPPMMAYQQPASYGIASSSSAGYGNSILIRNVPVQQQHQQLPPPQQQQQSFIPNYISDYQNISGFPGPPSLETLPSVDMKELEELFSYGNNNNNELTAADSFNPAMTEMGPPQPMPYNNGFTRPVSIPAPLGRQLSDSFPPNLNRATSEALNFLLPGGALWNQLLQNQDDNNDNGNDNMGISNYFDDNNSSASLPKSPVRTAPTSSNAASIPVEGGNSNVNPLQLMRSISWDVYNGSFAEDLQSILSQV